MSRVRTAALLLGVSGGIVGIVVALFAMAASGLATSDPLGGTSAWSGVVAGMLSVAGILGGALVDRSPRDSWVLGLGAATGGFVAVSTLWVVPGALLSLGAVLAFAARRDDAS